MTPRGPVNPRSGAEGRLFSLIFNGLTAALSGPDEFMPLSRRMEVTETITEMLLSNGLEPTFRSGLERLQQVAQVAEDEVRLLKEMWGRDDGR